MNDRNAYIRLRAVELCSSWIHVLHYCACTTCTNLLRLAAISFLNRFIASLYSTPDLL